MKKFYKVSAEINQHDLTRKEERELISQWGFKARYFKNEDKANDFFNNVKFGLNGFQKLDERLKVEFEVVTK